MFLLYILLCEKRKIRLISLYTVHHRPPVSLECPTRVRRAAVALAGRVADALPRLEARGVRRDVQNNLR